MDLKLTIQAPTGRILPADLQVELARILSRAEVAYQIEERADGNTQGVHLVDTSDVECRFIIRLLQRAGYNVELEEIEANGKE